MGSKNLDRSAMVWGPVLNMPWVAPPEEILAAQATRMVNTSVDLASAEWGAMAVAARDILSIDNNAIPSISRLKGALFPEDRACLTHALDLHKGPIEPPRPLSDWDRHTPPVPLRYSRAELYLAVLLTAPMMPRRYQWGGGGWAPMLSSAEFRLPEITDLIKVLRMANSTVIGNDGSGPHSFINFLANIAHRLGFRLAKRSNHVMGDLLPGREELIAPVALSDKSQDMVDSHIFTGFDHLYVGEIVRDISIYPSPFHSVAKTVESWRCAICDSKDLQATTIGGALRTLAVILRASRFRGKKNRPFDVLYEPMPVHLMVTNFNMERSESDTPEGDLEEKNKKRR